MVTEKPKQKLMNNQLFMESLQQIITAIAKRENSVVLNYTLKALGTIKARFSRRHNHHNNIHIHQLVIPEKENILHILYSEDRKYFYRLIRCLVKHPDDLNRLRFGKEGAWYFYCGYIFHLISKIETEKIYLLSFIEMKWCIGANSQEDLFNSIITEEDDWTWNNVKCLGLPLLMPRAYSLKEITQLIAKAEWKKTKNPYRCAVFYVVCKKIKVLAQIFREADLKVTTFLGKYQEDPDSSEILVATQKNAYGLLKTHRYDLAVAFFLLCGDIKAAINTAYSRMNDWQLAILINRVMEESSPESFHNIIRERIIPDWQKNDEFVAFLNSILSPESKQPKKLLHRYKENNDNVT